MTFTPGHSIDAPLFVEEAAKACIHAWVHNDKNSAQSQARVILENLDTCRDKRVEWSVAYVHGRVTDGEIFTVYGVSAADDKGKPTLTLYSTPTMTKPDLVAADEERILDWAFSLNEAGRMAFHPHPRSERTADLLKFLRRP